MREYFLLDPDVIFLNHGSFGACPAEVFEVYQEWQRELERQPVEFLGRRADGLLAEARQALATYLNAPLDDLVYITNATVGVNIVARSLAKMLKPGDEILTTNHEYGACDNAWEFVCKSTGARYIHNYIGFPLAEPETLIEDLWAGVTERTKVIYISHITSPTAVIFPIAEICKRARAEGILTVIDGAHAPGQIPLNMLAIGADFYTGNCHKWLCAPKGSAFLYARPEHHAMLDAHTISWGYSTDTFFLEFAPQSLLVRYNQYQGTRDIAAYLSVPAAIDFQRKFNWDTVREECHLLAHETQMRLADLTGLAPIVDPSYFGQMVAAPLPDCDPNELKRRLYDEYRIEIPLITWEGSYYVRASFQAYNTRADADALLTALGKLLNL